MNKYTILYESKDNNIIIYDTPTRYIFTTVYEGIELTRYIDKGSISEEELLNCKFDIEYDLIERSR